MILAHLAQPIAIAIFAFQRRAQIIPEQAHEMLMLQYLLCHLADHDAVELVHRHAQPLAAEGAFLETARATVIAILPTLAGVLDQRSPAMAASSHPGQQRRRVDQARRHPLGRAALQERLCGVEGLLVDDGRDGERYPFGGWAGPVIPAVGAIEVMLPMIGARRQDGMDASGREPASPPQYATLVEPGGDGFHTHGPAFHTCSHIENHANNARLGVVDDQHLLVLAAPSLGDLDTIAIGRSRAVPEALSGILQHGTMDMLGGFPALMLVEDVQQLAEHLAGRVLPDLLSDRDQFDPGLPQLADIEFGMKRVSAEAAQRMHDHEIKRLIRPFRRVDQFLKNRPVLVERGGAGLGEDLHHLDTLPLAPCAALDDLVGDRQVALGLAGRRHADIDCCAGHDPSPRSLRMTSAWREKAVKLVA
nr:hypothetical protein [Sphingobium sp. HDIP04]